MANALAAPAVALAAVGCLGVVDAGTEPHEGNGKSAADESPTTSEFESDFSVLVGQLEFSVEAESLPQMTSQFLVRASVEGAGSGTTQPRDGDCEESDKMRRCRVDFDDEPVLTAYGASLLYQQIRITVMEDYPGGARSRGRCATQPITDQGLQAIDSCLVVEVPDGGLGIRVDRAETESEETTTPRSPSSAGCAVSGARRPSSLSPVVGVVLLALGGLRRSSHQPV